jgi:hypothetical protein
VSAPSSFQVRAGAVSLFVLLGQLKEEFKRVLNELFLKDCHCGWDNDEVVLEMVNRFRMESKSRNLRGTWKWFSSESATLEEKVLFVFGRGVSPCSEVYPVFM